MNKALHLTLLGSPQILVGQRPLTGFATNKAQALLFYLAVTAQTTPSAMSHSRDALATLLWGEMTDVKAKQNLRTVLPNLRRLVEDYLQIDRQSVAFNKSNPYWLDVAVFQRNLTQKSLAEDVDRRQTAVDLYRGEFLSGFTVQNAPAFDDWVLEQRQKLHITAVQSLFSLVNDYKKLANHLAALTANRRLLALEPWSEPAHRQQMLLLAQTGERSAALAQFEICREILAAEFNVEPLPETIMLFKYIRQGTENFRSSQPPLSPEGLLDDRADTVTLATMSTTQKGGGGQEASARLPDTQNITHDPHIYVNERDLPQRIKLLGRQQELSTLQKWVTRDSCRLVGIFGIGGQGKSALAATLVRSLAANSASDLEIAGNRIQNILWKSLLNAPPLVEVMQEWIYVLSDQMVSKLPDSLDQQFSQLLDYLGAERTLLVLDNVESILQGNGRSGSYRSGYETYGQLIRLLAEGDHRSCLLLTSRERPQNLASLEEETPAVRILPLAGLPADAGKHLLQARGLVGDADGLGTFVQQYSGNPLALKLAAETVQEIFAGNIACFLRADALVFDDIRDVLDQQFARLAQLEQELMVWLAIMREPVPFSVLQNLLAQPPTTSRYMLEAVRSLQRRSLLEKHEAGFGLQNVVLEYMTDCLVENIIRELVDDGTFEARFVTSSPNRTVTNSYFNCFALILAQSKAYVRDSQRRLLLKPVAEQLVAQLGVRGAEKRLQTLLARLQLTPNAPGYAGANLLHLLLELGVDLRGYDFSQLYLRQLYLRGISLPQINFTQAEVVESVFTEPFGLVYTAVFSPDGQYIAAGTSEGAIYIWRTIDQQLVQAVQAHNQTIDDLAFEQLETANDSKQLLLASASNDGRIGVCVLTEHESERQMIILAHPEHSKLISVNINGRFVTGVNTDGQVFVWDIADYDRPRLVHKFATILTRFGLVAYSGDGQIMAVGNRRGPVQLYSVKTGQRLLQLTIDIKTIATLAMSRDGQLLAVGGKEGQIGLWRVLDNVAQQIGQSFVKLTHTAVDALAFRADGKKLASTHGVGDQTVRLWSIDTQTGLQLTQTLPGHTDIIWSVAFGSPPTADEAANRRGAQPLLVTGSSDQTVRVWDVATGHTLYTLRGQPRALSAIAIHRLESTEALSTNVKQKNNWLLAAVGYDHLVHLWQGQGYEAGAAWRTLHGTKGPLYAVVISANGRFLATAGYDQRVYLWDVATGQLRQTFHGHTNSIFYLGFHPAGDLLASGSADGTVRLWRIHQFEQNLPAKDSFHDQTAAIIQAHPRIFYEATISADGCLLATVGSDRSLRLWDMTQGDYPELVSLRKTVAMPGEEDMLSVAFSPDGSKIVGGGSRVIHLWDVYGDGIKHFPRQHTLSILSLAFTSDGTLLVSGSADGTACLWNVACGNLRVVLRGHSEAVYQVAFSPDGTIVLSCSFDGTIRFWDVQTGQCAKILQVDGPYAGMNITSVTGITEAQKAALIALGAVEKDANSKPN